MVGRHNPQTADAYAAFYLETQLQIAVPPEGRAKAEPQASTDFVFPFASEERLVTTTAL